MLNLIASAIKAKAPIVAIPVDGHAPVCLNRKRLAAWSKGVTILSAHVVDRTLVIAGRAGNVKVTARFYGIDRRVAVKELSKWSQLERERRTKKILLGALSPEQKKSLKMAKYEGTGGEGIPVEIPELPLLRFAVFRVGFEDNFSFNVKELGSGKLAGFGATAEAAILNARQKAYKLSPEARTKLQSAILSAA